MNQNPRYGIPDRTFPYVSYCELFNAFNNGWNVEAEGQEPVYNAERDECRKIRELGELMVFHAGSVGNNHEDKEIRDSEIAWINDDPNQPEIEGRVWLLQRMADTMGMVNRDKFQLLLNHFNPMQFTKYGLNQHYTWHVDVHENQESTEHRKLSAVLFLTGPDEYEGGELLLNIGGNPESVVSLRPPAGTVVFFYSHIPHCVMPVTKGDRATIVVWGLGPKIQ